MMLMSLMLFIFHDALFQSISTYQKVGADLEIYRVERSMMALLRENIDFNVEKVQVLEGLDETSVIMCEETAAKRKKYYYCSESPTGRHLTTLYQRIKVENKNAGVNPLTTPGMEVTAWHAEKLSEKSFLLTFSIREYSTNREKKFFEVINLCNGKVL